MTINIFKFNIVILFLINKIYFRYFRKMIDTTFTFNVEEAYNMVDKIETDQKVFLHKEVCKYHASRREGQAGNANVIKVMHPTIKQRWLTFPINFVSPNQNAASPSDAWIVEDKFLNLGHDDILNLCVYYGTLNSEDKRCGRR